MHPVVYLFGRLGSVNTTKYYLSIADTSDTHGWVFDENDEIDEGVIIVALENRFGTSRDTNTTV
jgi:hypothetical protein